MKQKILSNVQRLFGLLRRGVLLLLLFGVAVGAGAQSMTVSGTVSDEGGEPLIGASILVQGTTTGTITDYEGKYSLEVKKGATLVISYTGYSTQSVEVGSETTINITMATDAEILSEVVVTGYQTQRKRDISGAVSVVETDDLETIVASSFAQKLAEHRASPFLHLEPPET